MSLTFTSNDIADAFGLPRNTKCVRCHHGRYRHNHGAGQRADLEQLGTCQQRDRRTTTGRCKCAHFEVFA
jgi:hypothetical protein